MTILNMAGGGGNNINVPLNGISNLTASSGDGQAVIKRTDVGDLVVNGVTVNEWSCTKLVRKTGSAPASSNDGIPVLTETLENSYSVTGYTNTGLTNGTKYYYGAFSVGTNGLETISNIATVTPSAGGWQPGANTIAYYEFNNNLNDSSGNGHDLSILTGTVTYGADSGGGKYAYFDTNTWSNHYTGFPSIDVSTLTVSYWWQPKQIFSSGNPITLSILDSNSNIILAPVRSVDFWGISGFTATADTWYHLVMVIGGGVQKAYVNGQYLTEGVQTYTGTLSTTFTINNAWDTNSSGFANDNYISELIIEDKSWTAQEISDYFDQTKGNYGIS